MGKGLEKVRLDLSFVINSSRAMQKNHSENLRIDNVKLIVEEMIEGDRRKALRPNTTTSCGVRVRSKVNIFLSRFEKILLSNY